MSNDTTQRTPLLGQRNRNAEGRHAIFLRVCYSPWSGISQIILSIVRGIIATYLIVAFVLCCIWQTQNKDERMGTVKNGGWLTPFRFETISLLVQTVYTVVAFAWTLMHFISPHHSSDDSSSFGAKLKRCLCHPTGDWSFAFSLFYAAAVSFPHVVVLIFWTIIVPHNKIDVDDLFSHGGLQTFAILNLYFFGSVVALIEVFFLNSIRRPGPSYSHILGFTVFAVLYFLWAYLARYLTGKWCYYFLNYKKEGWENVFVALLAFISLLNIFYAFVYGLISVREAAVDKEDRETGYEVMYE